VVPDALCERIDVAVQFCISTLCDPESGIEVSALGKHWPAKVPHRPTGARPLELPAVARAKINNPYKLPLYPHQRL